MRSVLGFRNDAFLTNRDLEAIDRTVYQAKEEELSARLIVRLKTDDPPGAESIGFDMITRRGAAKIFSYGGVDDVPLVDADVTRHVQRVYGIVLGMSVDVQSKRAAQMANRPIDILKADACRRGIAEKENGFFYIGSAAHNAYGLTNATGIQVFALPDNGQETPSTLWKDKSGEQIIEDIRQTRKKVNTQPGMMVDTLILPPDQYEDLDRPVNAEHYEMTIRQWLKAQSWFKSIQREKTLEKAGTGGAACMVVCDSSVVQLSLPMDLTRHPEVLMPNLASRINFEERTGGAVIRYPLGICRADGI